MTLYHTVVLVALSGDIGDLFDTVISLSDRFFFFSRVVRYSSIQFFSALTVDCHNSAHDLDSHLRSSRSISNSRHTPFGQISSNRLEVTVHKAYEEHSMSQTNHYASYPSSDVQLPDKPLEISFDDNTEDRPEK